MTVVYETPAYDPRCERAQTLEGAKERYAAHDNGYHLEHLECDLKRILAAETGPESETGDDEQSSPSAATVPTQDEPILSGQSVYS